MTAASLRFAYLYLTDNCNLRCLHCWRAAPEAESQRRRFLRLEECGRFFDDAIRLGLQSVTISGGEPLLSPAFDEFVSYFDLRGIRCSLETNGMLLHGSRLQTIARHHVSCAVSLDGATAGTHDRQRGRDDAFERTRRGMRALDEAGIRYEVVMALSRLNHHELVPLLDLLSAEHPQCAAVKLNIVMPEGRASLMQTDGLLFSGTELCSLADTAAALRPVYRFPVTLHVDPVFASLDHIRQRVTCGGHCGYQNAISVLADGSVSICSLGQMVPEFVFGHVGTIDLERVWNEHPLLQAIHGEGYKKLTGVCGECIFRRTCMGGCRAHALWVYGDLFGPAPLCQAFYESGAFPASRLRRPPNRGEGADGLRAALETRLGTTATRGTP